LTLDAAIERMMAANLDIQALRHELPQADADIVTAGLRTNPLIYLDGQFIPYGSFTDATPGGPTQYDVNITYPVDVSHKRQSRTVVARMARTALEAQFQDVVRRQIGNVGNAFITLQGARLAMLSAEAAVKRHRAQLAEARRTGRPDAPQTADLVEHEAFLVEQATLALIDTTEAFEDAQESLAVLLNEPPETTGLLQPRGSLRHDIRPPSVEELTSVALKCRPDIRSMRAGVSRANAEVALQRANRFDDIYLFYDPITIQDNRPIHAPNSRSWAVGVTFALPIYNRNQGNIARAISNVQQTRQELSSMERRVTSEVRLAEREYQTSKRALEQIEKTMLPQLQSSLRRRAEQFARGDISLEDYQSHVEESTEVAQNHRDALIRHRRSMVDLNTAVGLRVLP
ncbi:MAG: TolC family protein, partial [Planctomycetia bacterium]|nr:TolC family protein [Planctomycetia bacterium]